MTAFQKGNRHVVEFIHGVNLKPSFSASPVIYWRRTLLEV